MADVVLRPWLIMRYPVDESSEEQVGNIIGTLFLAYAGGRLTWTQSALRAIRFETEAELDWFVSNVQLPTWPDTKPLVGLGYGPVRKRQVCFQGAEEAYLPAPAAPMRLLEYRHAAQGQVYKQFLVDDMVEKKSGYPFDGRVIAVFQTSAKEWRVVVEKYEYHVLKEQGRILRDVFAEPSGLLHIFHPKQLRKVEPDVSGQTALPIIEAKAHGRREHTAPVSPESPAAPTSREAGGAGDYYPG